MGSDFSPFPKRNPLDRIAAEDVGPGAAKILNLPSRKPANSAAADEKHAASSHERDEWPEPKPLGDELPPVPTLNLETVPQCLRVIVVDTSERIGCTFDFVAAAAIAMLAAVTNRRAFVQPKVYDTGWVIPLNLWCILIGESGTKKTAGAQAIIRPVKAIEGAWWEEHKKNVKAIERQQEEAKLDHQAWMANYVAASKKGETFKGEYVGSEVDVPMMRRLFTSDPTVEKLQDLLSEPGNAAGLTLERDELFGFFANLSKPGRDGDRQFFLECANGDGSFTVDRVQRGSVRAEHLCLSIFGGTQPRRWRNLFRDEIETGVSTDGMMQRFPLMIWPDTPRLPYVDRAPDQTAIDRAAQVYGDLAALDVKHPLLMRFSPEAQALFVEYNFKLMQRVDCDDLPPAMRAHLAKFESAMPKLAALFALADGAIEEIDLHHARMAAAYCDYLEAHARRAYSPAIDRAKSGAIRLGARLRKGWRSAEGFFSIRDVYQHDWTDLKTPEEVRAAVGILVDAGWVREIPVPDDAKAGRPSEQFAINPGLAEVADGSE